MKIRFWPLLILILVLSGLSGCNKTPSPSVHNHAHNPSKQESEISYYTCTMHPSVRSKIPGKCPICGMELVPVLKSVVPQEKEVKTVYIAPERQRLIGVQFTSAQIKPIYTDIRTVGTVAYNAQKHWNVVARNDGFIQKFWVSSPGEFVKKHQPLLDLYSPELVTTQKELVDLFALKDQHPSDTGIIRLIASAKKRLLLWNMTQDQLRELEKTRNTRDNWTLYSPFEGILQTIHVAQGSQVTVGDPLMEITDLSTVWVWATFYQNELAVLKPGLPVTLRTSAYPNTLFKAKIALVAPTMSGQTRSARVRIDVANPGFLLKPEMFVDVYLKRLQGHSLTIPITALMQTGERNLVFVDKGHGKLEPRFVQTGKKYGEDIQIESGLMPGDSVVNHATFLIDAESKIQGVLKAW